MGHIASSALVYVGSKAAETVLVAKSSDQDGLAKVPDCVVLVVVSGELNRDRGAGGVMGKISEDVPEVVLSLVSLSAGLVCGGYGSA